MKFFNKYFLLPYHLQMLRESRKKYYKNKIVNCNNNVIEVINFEKQLLVYPEKDEILEMINNIRLIKATRLDSNRECNYIYEELPSKLKRYMYLVDERFFNFWYKDIKNKVSGRYDNYEMRYKRLEKYKPDYTEEEEFKYVIMGEPIPNDVLKKAKDSARRTYKTVKGYINANYNKFNTFVTLTFALEDNKEKYEELNNNRSENDIDLKFEYVKADDFELTKEMFSKFINSLSVNIKRRGEDFYYIAVWELQKNGNYHFHIMCSSIPDDLKFKIPTWLDYDFRKHKFNFGYGIDTWKYGKSDIQEIREKEKLGTYVSKYIIKSFYNLKEEDYEKYLNKKKYFSSRNLEKPIEKYMDNIDIEKLIDEYKIQDKFFKEYRNPYNNTNINKTIYTIAKE